MTMHCWKCGAPVVGSRCLSCGCLQSTRQGTTTEVGKALRYAYDKFGPGQILTNQEMLRRCLSDLIPDEKKLRGQIALVMQTNVGQRLFNIMTTIGELDWVAYKDLAQSIQEDCGLTEDQASTILDYILEMIGCTNPRNMKTQFEPVAPPKVHPERKEMPPEPPSKADAPPVVDDDVYILASQKKVLLEDATHGVGWSSRGKRGDLYVRSDGIAMHYYHGWGTAKPSPTPDLFIPRQGIVKVTENFFIGVYAFTIVMTNGTRYRVTASPPKNNVLKTIEMIRSLIVSS